MGPAQRREVGMRRRFSAAISVAGASLLVFLFLAPTASAATACSFNAGTGVVTVTIDPAGSAILTVGTGGSAGDIQFDNDGTVAGAAQCDTATVNNTTSVTVTGSTGNESFFLDLTGGPFEPGTPAEGSGTSEIEFATDLAAGVPGAEFQLTASGERL